jgi:AraC-like DNA-binding protein
MIHTKREGAGGKFAKVPINWDAFQCYIPLKKILSHWSENRGVPFSVSQAAQLAAMTPGYFSRFFHEKVGVTFKYWVDFMRVRYAASLLCFADVTVLDLAEKCGFRDATTFTRTFRRILGLTPLQFKLRRPPQTVAFGEAGNPIERRVAAANEWPRR